ncbi:helix-turn-helix domain-containing protein [Aeromicrobium sp.]|uniref:PucR family transcriptional regulator n=1 Tax=Aeromicrobium sp. TaxID=1871063 RepID=UPI00199A6CE2|nr:helix-turn-helix domain-containing protein [Aeromicrobium sp.]MBC7631308.1 helix-turn-helix domain-containing protein [Aeromicrobium sp.]
MRQTDDQFLVEVTNQLHDEAPALGDEAADAIFTTLPSYVGVDRESVRRSVGKNIDRAIETLRSRRVPQPDTSAEAATTTQERAGEGVPIEDVIRGYRLSLRVIHDRFIDLATVAGIPAEQILYYSKLLWEVGDWFTGIVATEYRDQAVRETVRRGELVHDLVSGRLDHHGRRNAASALSMDLDSRYAVFYAVPSSGKSLEETGLSLPSSQVPFHVVTEVADRYLGLAADTDTRKQHRFIVAAGPRVDLVDLPESERIAASVLALVRRHEAGTYRLEDVTWRLAASNEPAVTRHLAERYLAPLGQLDDFGALLLDTVRAYLDEDRNITRTAACLVVHPNTLRYRLAKYEEVSGVTLSSTATLVELAWALEMVAPPR